MTILKVWNDELAQIAQRWADQCEGGHDKKRKKLDGSSVGQNAFSHLKKAKNPKTEQQVLFLRLPELDWETGEVNSL